MLLTNQHCVKGARGTPASSPRFSECPHSELCSLFHWPAEQIAPLFEHMQPAGVGQAGNSHFASSNERMLAANSATQECNKVARSGRKIEQNEVPKPGPQNRQFCGDAWAYPIVASMLLIFLCVRHRFGPYNYKQNQGPQTAPKMEPKQDQN